MFTKEHFESIATANALREVTRPSMMVPGLCCTICHSALQIYSQSQTSAFREKHLSLRAMPYHVQKCGALSHKVTRTVPADV